MPQKVTDSLPHITGWRKKLTAWMMNRYLPELCLNRDDLLKTASALGRKLKAAKVESEEWRQRCFSAENALVAAGRAARLAAEKHDQKHDTMVRYQISH